VVAYLLVSTSVLAGILLAGKKSIPGLPRFAVEDVHRFLGLLAGLFVAVHIGSVALDTVVPFSLTQLVVPFTAGYRPLATGLGVVAMELLVAVAITNRLRSRLAYRVWRRAHYATLAVWLLATVHGILSGTDRSETWLLVLYGSAVALVAGAMAVRFGRAAMPRRLGIGAVVGAGALALVLGLSALPQQASSSAAETAVVASVPELNGNLVGTIDRSGADNIVSISGTAAGSAFRIDLLASGSQVSDSALQLRLGSTTCDGTLTALDGTGFTGTCSLPGGGTRTVEADWIVTNDSVAGTLTTSDDA
jgi:sulfoxide reductase heme-binding subunit YedZ